MAAEPRNSKPRALLLSPEAPYPLAGGGALRTASLLQYLARRYDLDLIIFRQPGDGDPVGQLPPGLAERICVIDLPRNRHGAAARYLRNASRLMLRTPPLVDRFSGFERHIAAAISGKHYDISVIEHFWLTPYWEQIAAVSKRTILDLHNIESVWHARCAGGESRATAMAHRIFSEAAAKLERKWIPRFTGILTPSAEDKKIVLALAPSARVTVYPNAIPLVPVPCGDREDAVIFSGNLEYYPNVAAVRFFRLKIWPVLRQRWPGLVWRLIGKNSHAVKEWTSGDPRIEVSGPVPDAIRELARGKIAVVPLLAGSGTRIKILEAWAAALPVVSTEIGAEGLPVQDGRHLLLADGSHEFAAAVSRLLENPALCKELGRTGRSLLEQRFTWEKAWGSLEL